MEPMQLLGKRAMPEKAKEPLEVSIICQTSLTDTLLTPSPALSSATVTSKT